jgi:hypothetical protein
VRALHRPRRRGVTRPWLRLLRTAERHRHCRERRFPARPPQRAPDPVQSSLRLLRPSSRRPLPAPPALRYRPCARLPRPRPRRARSGRSCPGRWRAAAAGRPCLKRPGRWRDRRLPPRQQQARWPFRVPLYHRRRPPLPRLLPLSLRPRPRQSPPRRAPLQLGRRPHVQRAARRPPFAVLRRRAKGPHGRRPSAAPPRARRRPPPPPRSCPRVSSARPRGPRC